MGVWWNIISLAGRQSLYPTLPAFRIDMYDGKTLLTGTYLYGMLTLPAMYKAFTCWGGCGLKRVGASERCIAIGVFSCWLDVGWNKQQHCRSIRTMHRHQGIQPLDWMWVEPNKKEYITLQRSQGLVIYFDVSNREPAFLNSFRHWCWDEPGSVVNKCTQISSAFSRKSVKSISLAV